MNDFFVRDAADFYKEIGCCDVVIKSGTHNR